MSAREGSGRLAFGPFLLDLASRRLSRNGRQVPLGDRAFGVLAELATHPGETLDKDTLIERVWPDVGVSDEALSQAVHELRRALGDNPRSPSFVQTVHGRGYRFVAAVSPAAPVQPRRILPLLRGWPAAALAVLLGGSLLVVAVWTMRRGNPQPAPPQRIVELVRLPGGAFKPAVSPDGRFVAVVSSDEAGNHSIFLVRPGVPTALQLTRGLDVRGPSPTFSADGNWVLFTSYRSDTARVVPDVWRVPVLGGQTEVVVEGASAAHQDRLGRQVVFCRLEAGGTAVVVRDADGREWEVAREGFWPRWSPDGNWIAYTTSNPEGGEGDLFVVRPDGSERRRLTQDPFQFYGLDWTAGGEGVVYAAAGDGPFLLWWVSRDGGLPVRLTVGAGDDSCPVVAPDGSRLLFVNGRLRGALFVADKPPSKFRRLGGEGSVLSVALDATGSRVAVVEQRTGGEGNLRVVELGENRELPVPGVTAMRARWTPDGRALVVAGGPAGGLGGGIVQVAWPSGAATPLVSDGPADWPELQGQTLVFLRPRPDGTSLVLRRLADGDERVLARGSEMTAPRLSPDGRLVAWSGFLRPTDDASTGIWVASTEGEGPPRRLVPDGAWPVWDGPTHLLFVRGATGDSLWRVALSDGALTQVQPFDVGFPVVAFDAVPGRGMAAGVHVDTPAVFAFEGWRPPR